MFQFLGDVIGSLLMLGFGIFAFLRPYHLSGADGPPSHIEKRARQLKRLGAAIAVCGGLLFIGQLLGIFFNL